MSKPGLATNWALNPNWNSNSYRLNCVQPASCFRRTNLKNKTPFWKSDHPVQTPIISLTFVNINIDFRDFESPGGHGLCGQISSAQGSAARKHDSAGVIPLWGQRGATHMVDKKADLSTMTAVRVPYPDLDLADAVFVEYFKLPEKHSCNILNGKESPLRSSLFPNIWWMPYFYHLPEINLYPVKRFVVAWHHTSHTWVVTNTSSCIGRRRFGGPPSLLLHNEALVWEWLYDLKVMLLIWKDVHTALKLWGRNFNASWAVDS